MQYNILYVYKKPPPLLVVASVTYFARNFCLGFEPVAVTVLCPIHFRLVGGEADQQYVNRNT
jgi:hypothetical protein